MTAALPYYIDDVSRLMAEDGITIIVDQNAKTASFDLKKNILTIPVWDVSKETSIFLRSHEVSHKLFTPLSGWHDNIKEYGKTFGHYMNVVEDSRVDRLMQQRYPGLVRDYTAGYKQLYEMDVFGLNKVKDLSVLKSIDKVNIALKFPQVLMKLSKKELEYIALTERTKTFEDVVEVAKKMFDETIDELQNELSLGDLMADMNEAIGNMTDEELKEFLKKLTIEQGELKATDQESKDILDKLSKETKERIRKMLESIESSTETSYRENEEKLVKKKDPNSIRYDQTGTPFLMDVTALDDLHNACVHRGWYEKKAERDGNTENAEAYGSFLNKNIKIINTMVSEFFVRRAALDSKNQRQSRSGVINVNRLPSYQFENDIFLNKLITRDHQSHGLVLAVDYSSSMSDYWEETITSLFRLAEFCIRTSIPFEVYFFTSGNVGYVRNGRNIERDVIQSFQKCSDPFANSAKDCIMLKVLDNKIHRNALPMIFNSLIRRAGLPIHMGSTPLDAAIMIGSKVCRSFKNRTNLQKVHFFVLTDGENTQQLNTISGHVTTVAKGSRIIDAKNAFFMEFDGQYVESTIAASAYSAEQGFPPHLIYSTSSTSALPDRFVRMCRAHASKMLPAPPQSEMNKGGFTITDIHGFLASANVICTSSRSSNNAYNSRNKKMSTEDIMAETKDLDSEFAVDNFIRSMNISIEMERTQQMIGKKLIIAVA